MKSVDEFDDNYSLDDSLQSEFFEDQEGYLETFGKDFELVLKIHNETPKRVWTTIDGDDGGIYLVNGLRYINRINYVITKEEAKNDVEEYLILKSEEMENL